MITVGGLSPTKLPKVTTFKYKKITGSTDGVSGDVWTPASDKKIDLIGVLVSATDKGEVEISDKTAEETIAVIDFNEKKSVPIPLGFELLFPADHVLQATFTSDTGTPDCHITAFGREL